MSLADKHVRTAAARLRAAGTPYLIATVVRVRGSSYRRPGARMIATETERVAGSVSGGCLEAAIVRTGWWRTRTGPVVLTFDSTELDADEAPTDHAAVLGCGGIVDILLERGGADDLLALADRALAVGAPITVSTVYGSRDPSLPVGTHVFGAPLAASPAVEVLVETLAPPPHLFVFGAGFDAVPLVEHADKLGWDVSVWNGSGRFGVATRFSTARILGPDLAAARAEVDRAGTPIAVVMGHDVRRDRAALEMLLASRARYIGVLGPRHRTHTLVDDPTTLADARLHAPVGLDLGAETPEEIALAVAAEALAAVRGGSARALRSCPDRRHSAARDYAPDVDHVRE